MASTIQRITGTSAKIAARLCNFVTAKSFLLPEHINFLDNEVAPVIRGMQGPWIDMFGYASRRSDINFNQGLSEQRINSVKSRISEYANQVNFQISVPLGESESGPDESDNSGYYRAVEVYVYAFKPPPKPKPPPLDELATVKRFIHREFWKHSEEGENFVSPEHNEEEGKKAFKGVLDLLWSGIDPESSYGDESKKAGRVAIFPADFRVNRVTLNQNVSYDHKTFASMTSIITKIDYVWGPPLPVVTVITNYQTDFLGVVKPPISEIKTVTRKDANLSAIAKPPNP